MTRGLSQHWLSVARASQPLAPWLVLFWQIMCSCSSRDTRVTPREGRKLEAHTWAGRGFQAAEGGAQCGMAAAGGGPWRCQQSTRRDGFLLSRNRHFL